MSIAVRRAKDTDVDWLLEQLRAFSDFFGAKRPLFADREYANIFISTLVSDHLVLVAECGERGLLGFIAGTVGEHPYNKEPLLAEQFWWVPECHRGSRAGLLLLKEFVEWGKANRRLIAFSLEAKSPVNDRCLTKLGFKLFEYSYLWEAS
jgi:hypothetical protein